MANNNENKILNVPPLRFPEFSGEWKCTTIGNIGDIKNGPFGSVLHAEDYVENGIPIVTTEHFKTGLMPSDKFGIPQVSNEDYIRLKGYRLETNDIVFSRVGSVDINAHVGIEQNGWLFSGRVLRVRPKYDIDSLFLHYALSTEAVKRDIRNRAVGQTMPSINTPILSSTTIQLPKDLFEQKKVAHFLRLLDERIITQNKIIEDLKKLKSAIIHRCYSSQTKMIPLSELLKQCSDRNRSGSDLQVLSVSNKYGFIAQSDQFEDREVASDDTSNYKVVKKGMFAYNPARINIGSIALYEMDGNGIVSPMYVCFTTKSELLPSYLKYYFASQTFKHEMYKRLEGSVRLCLTFEELCNIEIHLPSIEQQKNISKYISKIENNLSLVDSIFSKYQQQRRYLLSQMFI